MIRADAVSHQLTATKLQNYYSLFVTLLRFFKNL